MLAGAFGYILMNKGRAGQGSLKSEEEVEVWKSKAHTAESALEKSKQEHQASQRRINELLKEISDHRNKAK